MEIIKLIRLMKNTIIDVGSLTKQIVEKENIMTTSGNERILYKKDYAMVAAIITCSILFMVGFVVLYPNTKLMLYTKIYSCTLLSLMLVLLILTVMYRAINIIKAKKIILKCIKGLTWICMGLGAILLFVSNLFKAIFVFKPRSENTTIYMIYLVFLDFLSLLFVLGLSAKYGDVLLDNIKLLVCRNIDENAILYGIVVLFYIEVVGAINYVLLAIIKKIEQNKGKVIFKVNMLGTKAMEESRTEIADNFSYDLEYIKHFCWFVILCFLGLIFAIGVFFPDILFLENEIINLASQSAFLNVIGFVSFVILIFDKRFSWFIHNQ